MCMPAPKNPAPVPTPVPSIQSASQFDLGGQDRGAAQLGRLALRLGSSQATSSIGSNSNPATTPPAAQSNSPAVQSSTGSTAPASAPSDPQNGASGRSGFAFSPNSSLRIPA